MNAQNNHITVDGDVIPVRPSEVHEYLLETKLVARGYGVSKDVIKKHKVRQSTELVEGKHWVGTNSTHPGSEPTIFWTKRGIVRLGFFIRSERAKRFRDAAEDLILRVTAMPTRSGDLATVLDLAARALRSGQSIAQVLAMIAPAMPYGTMSRATKKPRERLVPAYYTSRWCTDERTRQFLAMQGLQLDFMPVLTPLQN